MGQVYEDHGYTPNHADHELTAEEIQALQNAMGMSGG